MTDTEIRIGVIGNVDSGKSTLISVLTNKLLDDGRISVLNEQIDGDWRLPNRKELESLVCRECDGVKINTKLFPQTPAQPFWTSKRNWWSPKFFWSVNFFTGHSYGRFVPEKKLFVRFLRDR